MYPQGARKSGTGFSWNIPGTPAWQAGGADEADYLRQLVTLVSGRYCADARRIYATGFSGGAREVSELACAPERVFAAVAAVGGLRAPAPCAAGPVPVLAIHGTADPQNPYDGHGQAYWTYSVPDAARRWAQHDGCAAAPTVDTVPGATLTAYGRCQSSGAVELYTLPGKGHAWPADRPGAFGANEAIWPRPPRSSARRSASPGSSSRSWACSHPRDRVEASRIRTTRSSSPSRPPATGSSAATGCASRRVPPRPAPVPPGRPD